MKYKVKPCDTVGYAFMVVGKGKFDKEKVMARGLTEWEARSYVKRLNS
jgi:hypothetical protein